MRFQDYKRVDEDQPAFTQDPTGGPVWTFQPGDGMQYRVQEIHGAVVAWRGGDEPPEIGGVIAASYDRLKYHSYGRVDSYSKAVCLFAAQMVAGLNPKEPEELASRRQRNREDR